jgi:putative oxidoreductase
MEKPNRYLPLLGRVLIGTPLVLSGLSKLASHDATVGYIASVGLPFAQFGWLIAIAVEMGGATLLVIGYRTRVVAFVVALFTLVTAIFFHRDFARSEPDDPFPQEHHARRWPAADRLFWRRSDEH